LYFTEVLWPEFDALAFEAALASYRQRERRFGRTSEQLSAALPLTVSPTDARVDA
jgi:undecaprenyl diphosphate synthase